MVNKDRLIKLFFKLVQIDSPTGEEEEVRDFVLQFLEKEHLVDSVVKDKFGNIYAYKKGLGEPLFLSAHLDTVEPGRKVKPKIENGYIISSTDTILGVDDKSAVAALLETLLVIKDKKSTHRPFELIFTLSEESENLGAVRFDYSLLKSKIGYCFDSTNPIGTVILAAPFYERFDIEVIGRSAHPAQYKDAINILLFLKSLLDRVILGEVAKDTITTFGIVQSGFVRNAIPGDLLIKGEIRSFTEKGVVVERKKIETILRNLKKEMKVGLKVEFVRENPGYRFDQEDEIVKELTNKLNGMDIKPSLIQTWGVSDANIFNQKKGLKVLNLGDGGEFAHTTRERIKVTSLLKLSEVMINLVK